LFKKQGLDGKEKKDGAMKVPQEIPNELPFDINIISVPKNLGSNLRVHGIQERMESKNMESRTSSSRASK